MYKHKSLNKVAYLKLYNIHANGHEIAEDGTVTFLYENDPRVSEIIGMYYKDAHLNRFLRSFKEVRDQVHSIKSQT